MKTKFKTEFELSLNLWSRMLINECSKSNWRQIKLSSFLITIRNSLPAFFSFWIMVPDESLLQFGWMLLNEGKLRKITEGKRWKQPWIKQLKEDWSWLMKWNKREWMIVVGAAWFNLKPREINWSWKEKISEWIKN